MKISKSFSIDSELLEKLKAVENPSDLVNNLIDNYFSQTLEKKHEIKLKELEELESEIVEEHKERKINREKEIKTLATLKEKELEIILEKLEKNIEILEVEKELCDGFVKWINEDVARLDKSLEILDWVEKFREKNIRIGIKQLKDYYKHKQKIIL